MKKLFILLALLAAFGGSARGQGQSYTAGPFQQSGWLYVCPVPSGGTPCPAPSSIFSNAALSVSVSNPILMSAGSTVSFFAASGQYTIQFPSSGYSTVVNLAGGGVSSSQALIINPTQAPYNAPLTSSCANSNITITNLSNTVSCSNATFTSADIGKTIFGTCCGGNGGSAKATSVLYLPQGVINSVVNATTVTVCTTTGACTPVNATNTCSATPGCLLFWGNKATSAVVSALAAVYAGPGPCGQFTWAGILMVDAGVGNATPGCIMPIGAVGDSNLSIQGTGRANSILLMSPDFNFATCTGLFSSCFFGVQGIERKYFGIWGGERSNTGSNNVAIIASAIDDFDWDLGISGIGAQDALMVGYAMNGAGAYPQNPVCDGAGAICIDVQASPWNTIIGGYAGDGKGIAAGDSPGCVRIKSGATLTSTGFYFGPANSGGGVNCVNVASGGTWFSDNDQVLTGAGTNGVIQQGTAHINNLHFTNAVPNQGLFSNNATAVTYVTNSAIQGSVHPVLNTLGTYFIDDKTTFSGSANLGIAPTCAMTTGGGTGPACALVAGSTNEKGTIRMTPGTTPGATGTVTLTFAGTFSGGSGTTPSCNFSYANTGTGAWSLLNTTPIVMTTRSTTVPVFNWNQTGALTAASTYDIDYVCVPR